MPILDKGHGFMKYIIRNQINRDNFDREEKLRFRKFKLLSTNNDIIDTENEKVIIENQITYSDIEENDNKLKNECILFNLEFLPKSGNKVYVSVLQTDTPSSVVELVTQKCPLDDRKRQVLFKKLQRQMNTIRLHGN